MTGVCHIVLAMKPFDGNFAENAIKYGVAGLNVNACRIQTSDNLNGGAYAVNPTPRDSKDLWTRDRKGDTNSMKRGGAGEYQQPLGRFPANVIVESSKEIIRAFPETTSGNRNGKHVAGWKDLGNTRYSPNDTGNVFIGDSGSAARFFKQVKEYEE